MRTIIFCFILSMLVTSFLSAQQTSQELRSPDGAYEFVLNTEDNLNYSVKYLDAVIIGTSKMGFQFKGEKNNNRKFRISSTIREEVKSSWRPVYGEKSEYPDIYNEMLVELKQVDGKDPNFNIRIRAYNEGIAYRYEFTEIDRKVIISDELTEFALPPETLIWASTRAQSEIVKMSVNEVSEAVERPLLMELPGKYFVAIGEAGLVDFARMKFALKNGESSTLTSELSSEVVFNTSFVTPWRYVMASKRPGGLIENNFLLLNLNEPNKIADTSWIKPGKVIREVTLTTQGGMACVDFAVKHNLQFIEFDAGWYGSEYENASDATTVTVDPKRSKGPLELHKVIQYAKSKDIGVILYVNRRALEKQLDEVLPVLKSWGVAGVKYGFVNVGSQEWTTWLHDAVRKAADHQLMVDIHDEYRPTGYSRTYPNLMTQEGIRGDEESPDNSMVLNTLFTRMIAGAGDHTNCYMAERVDTKMGSHASQMAKAVCIYSPWQFLYWYDRPQGSPGKTGGAGETKGIIPELPDLEFYDALPTVWDDTKVLDGYPGSRAVIARKSNENWFVGVLNGSEPRQFKINLGFLEPGIQYVAKIFIDDKSMNTKTNIRIEKIEVNSETIIERAVQRMNGLAMVIAPK